MPNRTERASTTESDQAISQQSQLIESIYRIVLEPQTYNVFMDQWDAFIQDRLSALDVLRNEAGMLQTSEVSTHFAIAERPLEQARTAGEAQSPGPAQTANSGADPQFLIDGSGTIVWSNAATARLFRLTRTTRFDDLGLPDRYRTGLAERVANLSTMAEHGDPPPIFQMTAVTIFFKNSVR